MLTTIISLHSQPLAGHRHIWQLSLTSHSWDRDFQRHRHRQQARQRPNFLLSNSSFYISNTETS